MSLPKMLGPFPHNGITTQDTTHPLVNLAICLEIIIIILAGQRHVGGLLHLGLVLLEQSLVDNSSRGSKSRGSNELLRGQDQPFDSYQGKTTKNHEKKMKDSA